MRRVAIVHDWLVTWGGGEQVLAQILSLYPNADLFAVCDFLSSDKRTLIGGRFAKSTFIQRLPGARRHYRSYLPLMPLAIEQLDVSGYDIVISSSHAVAKGVLTGPDQLHVSYVHSPMRYAWDLQHQYLREGSLERGLRSWVARWILHKMRMWDVRTANGVDRFVANSSFVARRIHKVYGRDAAVVYPPVDVTRFKLCEKKEDFYLAVSRVVPYKKMDLIVRSFAEMPRKRLVVIGDGPGLQLIRRDATTNVEVLGYQPFEVLRDYMQRARAMVFAAEEDFGITPVEAQACGTPVIAYGKGGALETIRGFGCTDKPTGLFFQEQSVASIAAAVGAFEDNLDAFSIQMCRNNALRFSLGTFREQFSKLIDKSYAELAASVSTHLPS